MRHLAHALVLLLLAAGACRQLAGLENLVPPPEAAAPDVEPSDDGGIGCTCPGCRILASASGAQSIAVVDGSVYWLEPSTSTIDAGPTMGTGRLRGVSTQGGVPFELRSDLVSPLSLTSDGENLYFYESGFASIDKVRLNGTAAETTAERIVTGLSSISSLFTGDYGWTPLTSPGEMFGTYQCADTAMIALAGGEIYFAGNDVYDGGDSWALLRVSTRGGKVDALLGTLAEDGGVDTLPDGGLMLDAIALSVQDGVLYWLETGGLGCGVAGTGASFQLWSVPVADGRRPRYMSAFSEAINLIAAGPWVYVAEGSSQVVKVPIDGGPPETILDQQQAFAFARDDAYVYWSTIGSGANQGTIVKLPIAGGSLTTLVHGLAAPVALAVDEGSVYWADTVCSAILEAPTR